MTVKSKNLWPDRDSNPDLLLEKPVVLTPLLSFIFELIVGKNTLLKIKTLLH